jgi:glycosyltransferase involved in cell wall biosynthesis
VLLEGSACGLPLIATRVGGIPEVVQDGVNGVLLDKLDDTEELAGKITALLQNDALSQGLGQKARERVQERFAWQRIAQEQEAVYDRLLKL